MRARAISPLSPRAPRDFRPCSWVMLMSSFRAVSSTYSSAALSIGRSYTQSVCPFVELKHGAANPCIQSAWATALLPVPLLFIMIYQLIHIEHKGAQPSPAQPSPAQPSPAQPSLTTATTCPAPLTCAKSWEKTDILAPCPRWRPPPHKGTAPAQAQKDEKQEQVYRHSTLHRQYQKLTTLGCTQKICDSIRAACRVWQSEGPSQPRQGQAARASHSTATHNPPLSTAPSQSRADDLLDIICRHKYLVGSRSVDLGPVALKHCRGALT